MLEIWNLNSAGEEVDVSRVVAVAALVDCAQEEEDQPSSTFNPPVTVEST